MVPSRNVVSWLLLLISGLFLCGWGCHSLQGDFSQTPEGLKYRFHEQHKEGVGVLPGDMVTANVVFRTDDSVFFVSSRDLTVPYQFEIIEPRFPGDIYDAFLMLAIGDSATFLLNGDSLFILDFEILDLPDFIGPETEVYMDVKLVDVVPREAFNREREAYLERVDKMMTDLKDREAEDIQAYLKTNNLEAKPTKSGLYFIELKKGNGPAVKQGKRVTVDYAAMFINGEIFETTKQDIAVNYDIFDSLMSYQPYEYIHGDTITIRGWEEGLSYMKQGGRALLVIPSSLAYGPEGVEGYIPPYAPLVYDVEVLEVK